LLARALYRKPSILFLDETLDQVDSSQESSIRTKVQVMVPTMVMVSHRAESVANARLVSIV